MNAAYDNYIMSDIKRVLQILSRLKEKDEEFQLKVQRFIASKADLLFSMKGKEKLRRGVDYGVDSNQEGTVCSDWFCVKKNCNFCWQKTPHYIMSGEGGGVL